jgi:hypothetical protein
VLLILLPPLFCHPQLHQLEQAQHRELWYWLPQSLLVLLLLVVQVLPCQFCHPKHLYLQLKSFQQHLALYYLLLPPLALFHSELHASASDQQFFEPADSASDQQCTLHCCHASQTALFQIRQLPSACMACRLLIA